MTRIIMCGCNGKMGRVISQLVKEDENAEIVAGVDISGEQLDTYPVFKKITECNVEADAVIDFSAPVALDDILSVGIAKNLALVLCTTGYSEEEIAKIEGTTQQAISLSIVSALEKIEKKKKFF